MSKLGPLRDELTAANFVISGGVRVRDLTVDGSRSVRGTPTPSATTAPLVTVDRIGDFSTYTLRVVEREDGRPTDSPHHAFDPVYSCLDFSFQVGCPSPLDCEPREVCPRAARIPAGDRLPLEGLRVLPPAPTRPAGPARPGLA